MFAKSSILLTLLSVLGNQITVDVDVWPNAVKSQSIEFNSETLNSALVRELRRRGYSIGTSNDLPRLTVQVAVVTIDKPLSVDLHATIAAVVYFSVPSQPSIRVETEAASCSQSAKINLNNTANQRAQIALSKCIDQLANEISANFVRRRQLIVVR